jgi:hypothetical protein
LKTLQGLIDTIQARSNSDFDIKNFIVHFHTIKHDFQLESWIKLKFLQEFLDMLIYIELKYGQSEFGKRLFQIVKVTKRILSNLSI